MVRKQEIEASLAVHLEEKLKMQRELVSNETEI